jgi:hypothetical protein
MKRRNLIALLALAPLAACVVNLSFDIDKQFALKSTPSGTVTQTQTVNLSDYPAITDHKGNIKSLDFESANITISTVNPGTTATKVTGTLVLRASGAAIDGSQDVPVGTLTDFAITKGSSVKLPGSAALDAFLLAQVQGAGSFSAILSGTVDGATDIVVDVDVSASVAYDSGVF